MFGRKTNTDQSWKPDPPAAETTNVSTYSLETIMALQKALEGGLKLEENVPQKESRRSQARAAGGRDASPGLMRHSWKCVAGGIERVGDLLQRILSRKRQSKPTSA